MIQKPVSEKSPTWNVHQELLTKKEKKIYLHTVSLAAPAVATAQVYAAVPDVDVIYRPGLLLVKRSGLMPTETSGLGPWERAELQ